MLNLRTLDGLITGQPLPKRQGVIAGLALEITDERVIPLALDVTNTSQIQHASNQVGELDLLINNAGIAIYDDLSNIEVIEQHMAVNFFGLLK